jgi:hypothetical protein
MQRLYSGLGYKPLSNFTACSFGLSATSQQYFSLRTNQSPATSQQYFSLRTNQHQPSATSQPNSRVVAARQHLIPIDRPSPSEVTAACKRQ